MGEQGIATVLPDQSSVSAFELLQEAVFTGAEPHPSVLLVIYSEPGSDLDLVWRVAYMDDQEGREKAIAAARSIRGAVACVPIVYDFRETS